MSLFKLHFSIASLGLALFASVAAAVPKTAEEALRHDAANYAAQMGVDTKEAVNRLQLQDQIGALDRYLTVETEGAFGGLWIEHTPDFRVVVAFTDRHGDARLANAPLSDTLIPVLKTKQVEYSLYALEQAQSTTRFLVEQLGTVTESNIDVRNNRVELYVADAAMLTGQVQRSGLRFPDAVSVVEVDDMSFHEANIYGGDDLSSCTTGFTVVKNWSTLKGVLTAAHCGNSQSYSGTALSFEREIYEDDCDTQWHSTSNFTAVNEIEDGSGTRSITATKSRNSQSIGGYVCKHGKTTGYTCGTIDSKSYQPSYVPSADPTFIRVDSSSNLSSGGDSGGPWFWLSFNRSGWFGRRFPPAAQGWAGAAGRKLVLISKS